VSARPLVHLVRHGETEWNVEGRIQGRLDVPLSPRGREQAAALAGRLAAAGVRALVSSPQRRARDTADAIAAATGLPVALDDDLQEQDLGRWQGLTFAEAARADPEVARRFAARDPDARPPGGETRREMSARAVGVLERVGAEGAPGPVVVVAHGGPIMAILYRVLGLPLEAHRRFLCPNAGLTTLVALRDDWFARTISDVAHLPGPISDHFPFL
jgi:probable phosphoglycerate mutase